MLTKFVSAFPHFLFPQYLYENGWQQFITWFDTQSWYPLGRPIATTIFPGMQVTAVFVKNLITGYNNMTFNDVCVYIPIWFSILTSVFTGLLAYECMLPQNSNENIWSFIMKKKSETTPKSYIPAGIMGAFAMSIMSMIPVHMMRSIGGNFNNESVANTPLVMTFWLWCRSLRANDDKSFWYGALAAVSYFCVAATWEGYIFVLNLIAVHAAILFFMGRFSTKIYKAYTLYYLIGTILSMQVPIIGASPLTTLDHAGPAAVFVGYQVLQYCETKKKQHKLTSLQVWMLRLQIIAVLLLIAAAFVYLAPNDSFNPVPSKVNRLFQTPNAKENLFGNSSTNHPPTRDAYFRYFRSVTVLAPIGFVWVLFHLGDASSFLLVYAGVALSFSMKMAKLIMLLGPISSVLAGVIMGVIFTSCSSTVVPAFAPNKSEISSDSPNKKKSIWTTINSSSIGKLIIKAVAVFILTELYHTHGNLFRYCKRMARALSLPVIKGRSNVDGRGVIINDFIDAYEELRDKSPEGSRVLAWSDYGHHITQIANRTVLADGSAWNHENMALVGKILTSSEEEGYQMARHVADYVMVYRIEPMDDFAKLPKIGEIANSFFKDTCPNDPTCSVFSKQKADGAPVDRINNSLLNKLYHDSASKGSAVDKTKFEKVFESIHDIVCIYKILDVDEESKTWLENNRAYPPALEAILQKSRDFIPDTDEEARPVDPSELLAHSKAIDPYIEHAKAKLTKQAIDAATNTWQNTVTTSTMLDMIKSKEVQKFQAYILEEPLRGFMRASNGQGPMWWAYRTQNEGIAAFLSKLGVSVDLKDGNGETPNDMLKVDIDLSGLDLGGLFQRGATDSADAASE